MDDPLDPLPRTARRVHRPALLLVAASATLVAVGVGTGRGSEGSSARAGLSDLSVPIVADARGAGAAPRGSAGLVLTPPRANSAPLDLVLLARIIPDRFGTSSADSRPATLSDATDMRSYNGRPIRSVCVLRMKVTAYSPDDKSCGASADGITASGYSVLTNGGFLVAADPRVLPLGSLVSVPGYDDGAVVPVLDTGGAIKGNRLDVLYPTHELAMNWGVQELEVEVWDYADGLPNGFRRVRRPSK